MAESTEFLSRERTRAQGMADKGRSREKHRHGYFRPALLYFSLFSLLFSFFLFRTRRRDANMFDANARSGEREGNGSGSAVVDFLRALRYISCPTRAVPVSPHVRSYRFTCSSPCRSHRRPPGPLHRF